MNDNLKEEFYYFDDNDNIVDAEKAKKVIVRRVDGNDNLIEEAVLYTNITEKDIEDFYSKVELTEEDEEFFKKSKIK